MDKTGQTYASIPFVATLMKDKRPGKTDAPPEVWAALETIRGNVLQAVGRLQEAIAAHREAIELYDKAAMRFEACRSRINLGGALMDAGDAEGHFVQRAYASTADLPRRDIS